MVSLSKKLRKVFRKWDWLNTLGAILGVWAIANTYLDIARYGIEQGFYWWFCNLALIGVAIALIFKIRDHLIGWISIACFTQIFWVIDNIHRIFTGENFFGLVEFMYQPGLPLDEFVLSHYHYFTIPLSLIGLFYLPQKKESKAWIWVAVLNPFIFAVSYFVFPAHQNVNCIHEPCFPGLVYLAGPIYSLVFWACIYTVHLGICFGLIRFFERVKITHVTKRHAMAVFVVFMVASVGLATWDTTYKLTLPHFTCIGPTEDKDTRVGCRYTLDYQPGLMLLSYTATNKSEEELVCTTKMHADGQEFLLNEGVDLAAHEKQTLKVPIPYPSRSVKVFLSATCEPAARMPAGTKR